MKLEVIRFNKGKDSTNGILFDITDDKRKFLCYTLEDESRTKKVQGETCIPEGEYRLGFRRVGGFDAKYAKRFTDIHMGMLEILNVPNFTYVLIHCGNTDEDTAGCLLVGDTQSNNNVTEDGFIGSSTKAYKRIYKEISKALEKEEEVTITYRDFSKCLILSQTDVSEFFWTMLGLGSGIHMDAPDSNFRAYLGENIQIGVGSTDEAIQVTFSPGSSFEAATLTDAALLSGKSNSAGKLMNGLAILAVVNVTTGARSAEGLALFRIFRWANSGTYFLSPPTYDSEGVENTSDITISGGSDYYAVNVTDAAGVYNDGLDASGENEEYEFYLTVGQLAGLETSAATTPLNMPVSIDAA